MLTKKFRISLLLLLVLTLMGVIIFNSSPSPRTWKDVEKEKMLRVVTTYNYRDYFLLQGKPMGFGYEVIKRFADSLGYSLDITIESDYFKRINGLKSGEYDILMNFIVKTIDSDRLFYLTEPLALSRLKLVQKNNSISDFFIDDLADLEGKKIYIEKNSQYRLVIDNIHEETGIDFLVEEVDDASPDKLCGLILRDEISYAAVDEIYANAIIEYQSELDASLSIGFDQFVCWMVSDNSTRKKINEYILNFKQTPEYLILKKRCGI